MVNAPYPLQPESLKKSWIERHPHSKIPLGCLLLLLLAAAFIGILFTIIFGSFRASDVFKQAMARAQSNPEVVERLGQPIQASWLTEGNLNVSGDTGKADLTIPISGPRGKGRIRAIAEKSDGVWHFSELDVSIAGASEPINLMPTH